ncbi:MAG: YhbY family RNA-binding protein [Fibrobacterota bacterium]
MALNKIEKRRLKAAAHGKKPVVRIGKEGLTSPVIDALEEVISSRELIKVKFLENAVFDKVRDPEKLCRALCAECVGVVGHTAIIYRYNADKNTHV